MGSESYGAVRQALCDGGGLSDLVWIAARPLHSSNEDRGELAAVCSGGVQNLRWLLACSGCVALNVL